VLTFYLGLTGGSGIVFAAVLESVHMDWVLYPVAWMFLVPYTIVHLCGFAFLPFLAVMSYDLVLKEWNRWVGAPLIAIAFSCTVLICTDYNPLTTREPLLPVALAMGTALLLLLAGGLWSWAFRRFR